MNMFFYFLSILAKIKIISYWTFISYSYNRRS